MRVTYAPTNEMSLQGAFLILLSYAVVSSVLAVPYVIVAWYMPIKALNILTIIGWGFLTCVIAGNAIRLTHSRFPSLAAFLAVIGSLVGYYLSWTLWASLAQNAGEIVTLLKSSRLLTYTRTTMDLAQAQYWFLHPNELIDFVLGMVQIGTFRTGGTMTTGSRILTVWAMEFLIFTLSIIRLTRNISAIPYYEEGRAWFKKMNLTINRVKFPPDEEQFEEIIDDIFDGNLSYLAEGDISIKDEPPYFSFEVFMAPGAHLSYATVKTIAQNERRKSRETTELVKYVVIDRNLAEKLVKRFS